MNKNFKQKTKLLIEGASESTTACLLAMVQGNILGLTLGHLFIAAQTGIAAGITTLLLSFFIQFNKRWIMPILLGLTTAIVDYYTHPGSFGDVATEAIVTGIVAGLLSYFFSLLVGKIRSKH